MSRLKSKHLIKKFASTRRLVRMAQEGLYCNKMEKIGIEFSKEQKEKLFIAEHDVDLAMTKVEEIFADMIGKEIIKEVKFGYRKE